MPSKTLSVIISEETQKRLESFAKSRLWSVSQSARVLIEQGLEREGIESDGTEKNKPIQSQPSSLKELIEQLGVQMMKEGTNPMRVRELAMGAAKPNKKEQELLLRLSGLEALPD